MNNYKNYGVTNGIEKSMNMNVYDANEAFQAGTIFKPLNDPYKNYVMPPLVPCEEKEALMMEVQKYNHACHDLSLYLDLYPNDENALALRKKYAGMKKIALEKYEEKYGPVCKSSETMNRIPYPWSTTCFPWGDD